MEQLTYEVMLHVRKRLENCWIDTDHSREDTFTVSDGTIELPELIRGQFFIIHGSYLNDGLYRYPATGMADETSKFMVLSVKPPVAFLRVVEEINEWKKNYGAKTMRPFSSESFDGYSYTRLSGADGNGITWKDVFKSKLDPWRML